MMILVNYANEKYKKAQKLNSFTGKHVAKFDRVISFGEEDIPKQYYEDHAEILSEKRGGGLWLWKPYFITKVLNEIEDGDTLFYCDSGSFFIRNVQRIFARMDCEFWISDIPLLEKQFTRKATFEKMGCLGPIYEDTNQMQSGFIAIKKNDFTVKLMNEWLRLCEDKTILSPDEGIECSEFISHREDQSVLSLLCKKYGISPYLDPTQYGVLPEKYYYYKEYIFRIPVHQRTYKPFVVVHRSPNNKLTICIKQYLCAVLPRKIGLKFIKKPPV